MSSLEERLKQSRESLDFALQSANMSTWDIDLTNNTVSCSPEMLKLWGITPQEFTGHRSILQTKVHPEDREKMSTAINQAIQNHDIYELEYRIIPSPGIIRWVMSRGRCTYASDSQTPNRFSGVVFDITDKKLKEEQVNEAIKVRDQFFMTANHELRTPITCLQLQLKVIEMELKLSHPEVFSSEIINLGFKKQKENFERINLIIENILAESKIARGQVDLLLEVFDISEMLKQVIDRFQVKADFLGVKVELAPTEIIEGKWDRFRIEQVVLNLLSNAIRYGRKQPVKVSVKKHADQIFLTVKDQGIGIHPADHKRIFEQYERAVPENQMRGIGLGLYIANNIVKAHGGEIQLKSALDQGSEFTIILPCAG